MLHPFRIIRYIYDYEVLCVVNKRAWLVCVLWRSAFSFFRRGVAYKGLGHTSLVAPKLLILEGWSFS